MSDDPTNRAEKQALAATAEKQALAADRILGSGFARALAAHNEELAAEADDKEQQR